MTAMTRRVASHGTDHVSVRPSPTARATSATS